MRLVKQTTTNKFLNIKEVFDPETHCNGYQFAERRGVDSVAFIGYDANKGMFLLNKEFTPPLGTFLFRAFGGSLDKDKSPEEIVLDEVKEECGYDIDKERVHEVGQFFVSTQMNQYCHVFWVDLTHVEQKEREPENQMEAMAQPTWMNLKQVLNNDDWKAIAIIARAIRDGCLFEGHAEINF